jgi:hypothetical protein
MMGTRPTELERLQAELDAVAAELARSRERFLTAGRRPAGRELAPALLTYRRLYDRIAAVLAELTAVEAARPA